MTVRVIGVGDTPTAAASTDTTATATPTGVWFTGQAVAAIAFGSALFGAAVTYVVMVSREK